MPPDQMTNYPNKIIAFLDVLGFEETVKSLPQNPSLFSTLDYALNRIKSIEHSTKNGDVISKNLEVSVFSDSIAISCFHQDFFSMVYTIGWLQAQLMMVGIFLRGVPLS